MKAAVKARLPMRNGLAGSLVRNPAIIVVSN